MHKHNNHTISICGRVLMPGIQRTGNMVPYGYAIVACSRACVVTSSRFAHDGDSFCGGQCEAEAL